RRVGSGLPAPAGVMPRTARTRIASPTRDTAVTERRALVDRTEISSIRAAIAVSLRSGRSGLDRPGQEETANGGREASYFFEGFPSATGSAGAAASRGSTTWAQPGRG